MTGPYTTGYTGLCQECAVVQVATLPWGAHLTLLLPCTPSLRLSVSQTHEAMLPDCCACMNNPLGAPRAFGWGPLVQHCLSLHSCIYHGPSWDPGAI